MQIFDSKAVARALTYPALIRRLRMAFTSRTHSPLRHQHTLDSDSALLLMPAWDDDQGLGVKVLTAFTSNAARSLATVQGLYLLFDRQTGVPLACLDGTELTLRRTAAVSALACSLLAARDCETLVIAGTGKLAPHLIRAHAVVRPIKRVLIWGRSPEKARALVGAFQCDHPDLDVSATDRLEAAVRRADIVSCATMAESPLVRGAWLKPHAHLDLVGSYLPHMTEADHAAIAGAQVVVDTEAALHDAGELAGALAAGAIDHAEVATLRQLCAGELEWAGEGRSRTVFKSIGTALADLAAAQLVAELS